MTEPKPSCFEYNKKFNLIFLFKDINKLTKIILKMRLNVSHQVYRSIELSDYGFVVAAE